MKLIFNKKDLCDIVNTVQKAVTSKSTMPILECIKIEAFGNGDVIFTANNLDICIEYKAECRVEEEGKIAINSKIFGEIIRRFPDGDIFINVNETNYIMTLKCQKSEFTIQGLEAEDYPAIPEVDENYRFSMPCDVLKRMIRKTIFSISQNEMRKPILTGALFEIDTGVLTVVSTDQYRISKTDAIVDSSLKNTKFVIPGVSLREILKVLDEDDGNIDIVVSKRHVLFCFENFKIVSRLLEGEYVNYKPLFQTPNSIVVTVKTRDFTDVLDRVSLIINDDMTAKKEKTPVILNILSDKIDISCITGKSKLYDSIEIEKIGNDLEIAFNHRFLLEALRNCEDEEVKIEFTNPRGACYIKPTQNNDYIYMILPVRIYD